MTETGTGFSERKSPVELFTLERIRQRTEQIFDGVDLSKKGHFEDKTRLITFDIDIFGTQTEAKASVHGFNFATIRLDANQTPNEYFPKKMYRLMGYVPGRGECGVTAEMYTSGTKISLSDSGTANSPDRSGPPEKFDTSAKEFIAKIIGLTPTAEE